MFLHLNNVYTGILHLTKVFLINVVYLTLAYMYLVKLYLLGTDFCVDSKFCSSSGKGFLSNFPLFYETLVYSLCEGLSLSIKYYPYFKVKVLLLAGYLDS